jgi:hypothetical protein
VYGAFVLGLIAFALFQSIQPNWWRAWARPSSGRGRQTTSSPPGSSAPPRPPVTPGPSWTTTGPLR